MVERSTWADRDPSRQRVIVFGDVIDDVVVVPSGGIRVDTDTKSSIHSYPGGSAANTAAWLGFLGTAVDFVGIVGRDDLARHTRLLEETGVTAHLTAHESLPTGTIVVIVDGNERTMLTERGANPELTPDAVTADLLASASLLHLTGYSLFGRLDPAPIVSLIARAGAAGVTVTVDPGSSGFLRDHGVERFLAQVTGATIVFPNLDEAQTLTGRTEPHEAALALTQHFAVVAVTCDRAGVIVASNGVVGPLIPAGPVQLIDPTGAGDGFSAGFLHQWLVAPDAATAARAGMRVAALAITQLGARPRVG
ncbi:MAG: carbohydrate kinase family protein [Microbacteriaceae bacterium]|nr:carbohydrate kinase family protein [Microbacteriaceae bacterium]